MTIYEMREANYMHTADMVMRLVKHLNGKLDRLPKSGETLVVDCQYVACSDSGKIDTFNYKMTITRSVDAEGNQLHTPYGKPLYTISYPVLHHY